MAKTDTFTREELEKLIQELDRQKQGAMEYVVTTYEGKIISIKYKQL